MLGPRDVFKSLPRWLCWEDGHLIWLFMRYTLLRLLVNICMSCGVVWMLVVASHIEYVLELWEFLS